MTFEHLVSDDEAAEMLSTLEATTNKGKDWAYAEELVYLKSPEFDQPIIKWADPDKPDTLGKTFLDIGSATAGTHAQDCADAKFIANAPTYIRRLLAYIGELESHIGKE